MSTPLESGSTPTPNLEIERAHENVAPAHQWTANTTSRLATDPYSWMQAVHWIHSAGIYTPSRASGPREFSTTTVRIAQLLADLTPCRPGIDYLIRRTGLSERTVQYHLGMLRETGLLAYRVKGTRLSRLPNQASEFARVIPPVFDQALGIRTTGEGVQRRPVGIADHGRGLIGKLAKKAARKVRRKPPKKAATNSSPRQGRCTPMQGGTSSLSTAGITTSPSESKLASGTSTSPTPKKPPTSGSRKLNRVGRRYQLARQLITRVWWLNRATAPRIAWIVRDVADAGWTADEVIAWLNLAADPQHAHHPAGFLAKRLEAATTVWTTPAVRATQVEIDRDSRRSAQARHAEQEADWQAPSSPAVMREVRAAFAKARQHPADHTEPAPQDCITTGDPAADLETLPRELIAAMRRDAMDDPSLIRLAIDTAGETYARRLYTNRLVDLLLRPQTSHMTLHAHREARYA